MILDLDATDARIHGKQQGRFFHGYYDSYCYLPLYTFSGDHILGARLRRSSGDGAAGSIEELERIVTRLRDAWPHVRIIVRADSGFCREWLMAWCEARNVDFVLGLARNGRLEEAIGSALERARTLHFQTLERQRVFDEFSYQTLDSWSRARRVVGKAEHTVRGANPRFVVTSFRADEWGAQALYEGLYCARGEMENRIKEQQLDHFADRVSCHWERGNQVRMYYSAIAYALIEALRRIGLEGTPMARAQCGTIRLQLLQDRRAYQVHGAAHLDPPERAPPLAGPVRGGLRATTRRLVALGSRQRRGSASLPRSPCTSTASSTRFGTRSAIQRTRSAALRRH